MATETEPVEQQIPPMPTNPPTIPRATRVKTAFAEQRKHASARTRDWLATNDLDQVDIIETATKTKDKKYDARLAQQERVTGEAIARHKVANARHDTDPNTVSASELAALTGRAAAEEAKLEALRNKPKLPPTDREIAATRTVKKAARAAIVAGGGLASLPLAGATIEQAAAGQPMLLAALGTAAGYGWYLISRPFDAGQPAPAPTMGEQPLAAAVVNLAKPDPQPGQREFNAPPPPALTAEELEQALRNIGEVKPTEQIQILAVPQRDREGNTTVVFDLPPRTKVANLVRKIEEFAGALGRDSMMIDVTKAGTELRTSLWMTDRDPFEDTRPSPLLAAPSQIDAFKDGVPVAWAKRGNTIRLPISISNMAIGGGTRSGKGVGASNLVVGSTFDPRINLRIVAGKNNAEWNPYAQAGVASTYFKPNPDRLVALLDGLIADKDRRERDLDKLGKSKMVAPVIEQIGGVELLVIDELATYTRPGKPRRDEIVEKLVLLASVAAGAGILMVVITQYPSVDVFPTELAVNFTTKWAMRVDSARQSNAILGDGSSGQGRDASKFDPPRPGLGWLVNPFAGVTDKARSFDLDEDERGEITMLLEKAAKIREQAGRLAGQWDDPIEQHLLNTTGLSSAAGGPKRDGQPGRNILQVTPEQRMQMEALRGCLIAMKDLGRDVAQLDEMAELIGGGMDEERLGELLRAGGAGGTVK
ncbi:hypothetical protein ACWF8U_20360, partial [Streptomyces olivaceus]